MDRLINVINKSKVQFFLFFFSTIFLFRALNLYISLSFYPWFYEWNSIPFFLEFKNNIFSILVEHGNRNQYQLFTKIFYIIFFKLFDNIWFPKISTIILQIVPSIYLSLISTILFYKNIKSKFILIALLFSIILPGSLANFYHFSESHFYFQILLTVILFLLYQKYNLNNFLFISLFLFIIFLKNLNMAAVTITVFVTFMVFYLIKLFYLKKRNIFLIIFFFLCSFILFNKFKF